MNNISVSLYLIPISKYQVSGSDPVGLTSFSSPSNPSETVINLPYLTTTKTMILICELTIYCHR